MTTYDFTPPRVRRGRITVLNTAEFLEFLYNPPKTSSEKGVNLTMDEIPGQSDPQIIPVSGKAEILSFDLELCGESSIRFRGRNIVNKLAPARPDQPYDIQGELDWIRSLEFPIEAGGWQELVVTLGKKKWRCYLEGSPYDVTERDTELNPTRANVKLSFKIISDSQRFRSSIYQR